MGCTHFDILLHAPLLTFSAIFLSLVLFGSIELYKVLKVSVVQSELAHDKLFFKFLGYS